MIVKTLASILAARFLTGLAITNLLFGDLIKAVSAKAKNDKNTVLIVPDCISSNHSVRTHYPDDWLTGKRPFQNQFHFRFKGKEKVGG